MCWEEADGLGKHLASVTQWESRSQTSPSLRFAKGHELGGDVHSEGAAAYISSVLFCFDLISFARQEVSGSKALKWGGILMFKY